MARKFIGNVPRNLNTYNVIQEGKHIAQVYGETKAEALKKAKIWHGTEGGIRVERVYE